MKVPRIMALQTALLLLPCGLHNFKTSAHVQVTLGLKDVTFRTIQGHIRKQLMRKLPMLSLHQDPVLDAKVTSVPPFALALLRSSSLANVSGQCADIAHTVAHVPVPVFIYPIL